MELAREGIRPLSLHLHVHWLCCPPVLLGLLEHLLVAQLVELLAVHLGVPLVVLLGVLWPQLV